MAWEIQEGLMVVRRSHKQQQGVALLTVLLVVAIATVIGVSMASEQNYAIHRARNYLDQAQLNQYVLGGEELARQILYEDFEKQPGRDFFAESWNLQEEVYDFEEGELTLTITDLQSRFNVNALLSQQNPSLHQQRLRRLLASQSLPAELLDRLMDYIDSDQNRRALGAEDYEYLGLDLPYRTSGQPLVHLSELMLLLDINQEAYQLLAPYLAVLPPEVDQINVNTADSYLLLALGDGISTDAVESVIMAQQSEEGISTVEEFSSLMGTLPENQLNLQSLSVQSSFFQVEVTASFHGRVAYLTSVIYRNETDGSLAVIYREFGNRILPRATESEDLAS